MGKLKWLRIELAFFLNIARLLWSLLIVFGSFLRLTLPWLDIMTIAYLESSYVSHLPARRMIMFGPKQKSRTNPSA